MTHDNTCVVIYSSFRKLESALQVLQNNHFDMNEFSIIGKTHHKESDTVGFYFIDGQTSFLGTQSKFWNDLQKLSSETALFWIPGVGSIAIGGAVVSLFVATLKSFAVVGESGALTATLYSLGIPVNSITQYEAELKSNKFLLICQGKQAEVERAHDILNTTDTLDMTLHFC